MAVEYVKRCISCKCEEQVFLVKGGEPTGHGDEKFTFVQCPECGLIYLSPRPFEDTIQEYYLPDYHPFASAIEDDPSRISRLLRRYDQYKRYRAVARHAQTPGNILDIGCSTGLFLHSIQQHGWAAYGVEPSPFAANYAVQRFGLSVKQTVLEEAKFDAGFFDVVSLWDVFEHIYDPVATLVEIHRILKPGGLLLLNLPNPDSWERALFGSSWAGWDIPRHLYLFPLPALDRLLGQAKLRRIDVYSFTGRHGAMVLSLKEWLKQKRWTEAQKRGLLRLASSLPAQFLTYPLYNLANWLNKSSYMAVYARKMP